MPRQSHIKRIQADMYMCTITICCLPAYQKVRALFRGQSFTVSSSLLIGFTPTQPSDLSHKQLKSPFIFLQRPHGLPPTVCDCSHQPSSSVCDFKLRAVFHIYLNVARLERLVELSGRKKKKKKASFDHTNHL